MFDTGDKERQWIEKDLSANKENNIYGKGSFGEGGSDYLS